MTDNHKTWKSLAEALGVTPNTLTKWKRENAGRCPAEKNLEAWKTWMADNKSEGKGSGRIALDGKNYTKQDLIDLKGQLTGEQARRERAMANLRELEFRMKSESLVPQSEVSETLIVHERLSERGLPHELIDRLLDRMSELSAPK